jgi:hypothetical protein
VLADVAVDLGGEEGAVLESDLVRGSGGEEFRTSDRWNLRALLFSVIG